MSYRISEIEDAIVNTIKDVTHTNVKLGTPEGYWMGHDNKLPLILVSYTGAELYEKMYHGTLSFSLFFVHNKEKGSRQKIYEMMQTVFEKMQDNHLGLQHLNGFFQLQFDKFYYEDSDYLVFEQQYICLEI